MKKISNDLRNHIAGETTSLCRCWIIEPKTGAKMGFTDHDEDVVVDGILCERFSGMETSGIEARLGLNVDSAEVSGALQSDRISEEDIRDGKYDNAKVSTYIVNWSQSDQWMLDQVLLIGEIIQQDGVYRIELRSLSSVLDQTKGRHFVKRCQAQLGDGRCKFNTSVNGFLGTGTVISSPSPSTIVVSGLESFANGWFSYGHLTWSSGVNNGKRIEIADHQRDNGGDRIDLWQPMLAAINAGDQFQIVAGCDKQFGTCKAKFSNVLNFQGFPHIPGDSFALSYAANSEDFDGGPIVP